MIEFVRKLFGQSNSGATAKERLRLVLMTDHLALAPEIIDQMKRDLVEVISRYVEVDREKVEVNFEREDKALAMLANIPISAVKRPTDGGGGGSKVETSAGQAKPEEAVQASATASPAIASNGGAPPRRKRRKKSGGGSAPKPATAH
jgi:cell division topological specificity factor